MNIITKYTKQLLVCIVFFLLGFIAGGYFNDQYSKPKVTQEVTIGKQKVKGKNNRGEFSIEPTLNNTHDNGQTKRKRKENFIRRIFRGRRYRRYGDGIDTTGTGDY